MLMELNYRINGITLCYIMRIMLMELHFNNGVTFS